MPTGGCLHSIVKGHPCRGGPAQAVCQQAHAAIWPLSCELCPRMDPDSQSTHAPQPHGPWGDGCRPRHERNQTKTNPDFPWTICKVKRGHPGDPGARLSVSDFTFIEVDM